jgi:hypothetical protein
MHWGIAIIEKSFAMISQMLVVYCVKCYVTKMIVTITSCWGLLTMEKLKIFSLQLNERLLRALLLLLCNLHVFSEGSTLTSGPFNQPLLQDSPSYHFPTISIQLRLFPSSIVYWRGGVAQYSRSAWMSADLGEMMLVSRWCLYGWVQPLHAWGFVNLKYVAYFQRAINVTRWPLESRIAMVAVGDFSNFGTWIRS